MSSAVTSSESLALGPPTVGNGLRMKKEARKLDEATCQDGTPDDDLYPCAEPGYTRRPELGGCAAF